MVYRWKAELRDGSIVYDEILNNGSIRKLELVTKGPETKKISLVIDGEMKPIFFTRRFFRLLNNEPEEYRNIYFIGYSLHSHIYLESVDSLTNERRVEINGDCNISTNI